MKSPWIYRAPAIVWGFVILYLSLAPVHDLDPGWELQISDKLVHFLMYFSWIVLLYFGTSRAYRRMISRKKMAAYWLSAVFVGIIIEFLQGWMALGRSADLFDALANTGGAIAGLILSRTFHHIVE
jgi:VanZ family protein